MPGRPLVEFSIARNIGKNSHDYAEASFHSLGFGAQIAFSEKARPKLDLSLHQFGPAKLSQSFFSPHRFCRTLSHVSTDSCDYFGIYLVKKGGAVFANARNEVALSPGNYVLIDNRAAHKRQVEETCVMTGVHFPRFWLESKFPNPEQFVLSPVPLSGWGLALSVALDAISPDTMDAQPLPPDTLAEQVAYLMALAYGHPDAAPRNARGTTLERIRRAMRERLQDPTLSPASLAQAEGVALRTLYALFAAAGSSFGQELISLRLEQARALLGNPRFDAYSIDEIAQMNGFVSASHFGQRFRKAYGLTPRSYRVIRRS